MNLIKRNSLIALSFDDGYIEYVKAAYLLSTIGVKATFYLNTHIREWEKRPLLTTKQDLVIEIAKLGHEIGSHTCTHKDLRKCNRGTLIYELKNSKMFLEDLLGKEVLGFAYPWGFYTPKVLEEVSKYYTYARTTELMNLNVVSLLNSPPRSRYELGAIPGLAIKSSGLPKLLKDSMRVRHKHIILYTHVVQPVKLITFINLMKSLNAKFVTVYELFAHLAKEYVL
ncbi:MAG: polysaccharide deacetylase family protein [Candidatus Bathyarchaeia archaeon]